ncbi:LL-diaminopimelate aminotransferase [Virgibacillus sp. JSM 102003]|uniref:LL-diaminopimelate aminotransferase n=1 Tax=Virgibacillus sp. JSM 102003 TaxID=1562108 RepID=UPI0035C174B1
MKYRSTKLSNIPPYQFAEIQKRKYELIDTGVDIIDLGVGDPDLPTPDHIVSRMIDELGNPANSRYPSFGGCQEFREAVADFYRRTYGVELDPKTEVHALIGSKEGIGHLMQAVVDPGDSVLIPDPSYPVYRMATILAEGSYHPMPLEAENGFKPKFSIIDKDIVNNATVMFLNYPNNPTGATVDLEFYKQAVDFAKRNDILLINDSAYNMVTYNGYKAPTVFQVSGAKNLAVEFGSLSKSYSMTGWRIGYVVGNKDVINSLSIYKSNIDTGVFTPIQKAGAHALNSDQSCVEEHNQIYKKRGEAMIKALQSIGIKAETTNATIFLWVPVPEGYTSEQFVATILEHTGVIFTPGNVFGPSGEGYFRISLSASTPRINEAIKRIKELKDRFLVQ